MKVQVLPTPRCTGVQYNVFVYTDTKPSQVPKYFQMSVRLHFLDVHVNCQILKGIK